MDLDEKQIGLIKQLTILEYEEQQIRRLDKKMDDLRWKFRMNKGQIDDFESNLKFAPNSDKYKTLLDVFKRREMEIFDEGKSYKVERESLLKNIEVRKKFLETQLQNSSESKIANNIEIESCKIGSKFLRTAEFFFSIKTCKEVFYPLVGDWREEYLLALKKGRSFDAIFISIRNYLSFIHAMMLCSKLGKLMEIGMKMVDVIEFFNKFSK